MVEIQMRDIKVPMRDGVLLHTRLYLPDGGPHPALLRRTPYPWEWMGAEAFNGPNEAVARRGYALAVQYVRGRFSSEGEFEPFRDDVLDGYDAIDWLVAQDWCTGKVGMYGQSYEATVQLAAMVSGHPALTCIVPQAFGSSFVDGFPYAAPGVFSIGSAIGWAFQVASEGEAAAAAAESDGEAEADPEAEDAGNAVYAMYEQATKIGWHEGLAEFTAQFQEALAPLMQLRPGRDLEAMQKYAPWWRQWVDSHSAKHPYWSEISTDGRDDRIIPALNVGGWYDQFLQATIDRYLSWSRRAAAPADRAAQRLIIGPWAHGLSSAQWDGHVQASPELELFDHPDIAAFHRRWLHDDHGTGTEAPVKIFVMGDNVWRDEWEWPLARTQWTRYYLHGDGSARDAGGELSTSPPGSERPDRFDYDPTDPVPAVGGSVIPGLVLPGPGPYDQSSVESRPDVLVYTTAVLEEALEITGPVKADLWVCSSAVDTDFTAKLVDVFADGKAVYICQGIVRPRYSSLGGALLDPTSSYHLPVDMASTSYVVGRGHALRLEISSSCFPIYDVNPNTGAHYFDDVTGETVVAHQEVFHDHTRPTHITLPVVPREAQDERGLA